jgi:protein AaeX
MRFFEFDIFGVYVAPIAPMMLLAWVVVVALRRIADRFGLLRYVWHPALFMAGVYMLILGAIVLLTASRGLACPA